MYKKELRNKMDYLSQFLKPNILLFFVLLHFSSAALAYAGNVLPQREIDHPFLITKKEDFGSHLEKANREPWKSMKADALKTVREGLVQEGNRAYALQDYIGAVALAYILEPEKAVGHSQTVKNLILNEYSQLELDEELQWGGVVPPLGSFFVAILALDIVYDQLNKEEIVNCENLISSQIFKINRKGSWEDVRRGTHGTWDIYKGERSTPDGEYFESIMRQITPDGVSPVTIHYAWERVGGGDSRISKAGYMDVLEFTGIDKRYYNNERLKKFQRWLFGSSVNNSKEMAIIGDMLPTQALKNDLLHRRVGNFDEEAAGYAAWFHQGVKAKGHILSYILPREPLPDVKLPGSQIYTDGGAFFREKADDPNGLHAVLYNIKGQDEWHTHQETNGLALSGLGNRLLVNGGRLGEPTRAAALNNTLTINGQEHLARVGGGIVEGWVTDKFDYASGEAGSALSEGKHRRSLVLVHSEGKAKGYSLIFDEVINDKDASIHTYLHPANESLVSSPVINQEYLAAIDHYPTVEGTQLAFFYATPPDEVKIEKVQSAVPDRYPDYPDHNRLEAVYRSDAGAEKNIITVLSPFKEVSDKLTFKRISLENCTGAEIRHTDHISDYVFESNAMGLEQSFEEADFNGKIVLFRKKNGELTFYFIRKGTQFQNQGEGFQSDHPISLYIKEGNGKIIIYQDTELTLFSKDISTFIIEGEKFELRENYTKIDLKKGNYKITMVKKPTTD